MMYTQTNALQNVILDNTKEKRMRDLERMKMLRNAGTGYFSFNTIDKVSINTDSKF